MSCVMTREEATRLHEILDEKIGFFRVENMSGRALDFYNEKKEEFIESMTQSIPEETWFQGVHYPSVNLIFNSVDGLSVEPANGDKRTQEHFDEEINPLLKDIEHTSIVLVED